MSIHIHKYFALLTTLSIVTLTLPTHAQSITATPENPGTIIQHNGNTYTITGGTQAGNNLFHSFTELGLAPNEIANFLSNPQTQNILGRVTGGNPSIIQGLIQVTGGNSNLLLMNPAGIVFTQGASLNVPSSFTATTADAIGFANGIFTATGEINYANLTSNPHSFIFSGQNGSIVNAAPLGVNNGNLSLIGSSVINTGTLTAPNGNITITAIPDSNTVRINQEGMILGLEITPPNLESGITATDLPRLLTAPSLQDATGVTVGPNHDLRLTGSNISIDAAGNVTLAGQVSGQEVHLAAANDVNPIGNPESLIRTHNGQYSAPTVTRFAQNTSNPNAHIFLDATVPDYSDLLFGGKPGTTTTVVIPTEDGIAKITNTLTTPGLSLVDELHIVSEGSEGNFWLGNAFISNTNISQYQTTMQQWSQGLNVGADILLYACLTAARSVGEALLNHIASYTGADVAGSTNITGHRNFGGDWILERQVGTLEATTPFEATVLNHYKDTLAVFTATNGEDTGPGSLRQAILNAQANTSPGDDEIRFAPGLTQVTLTSAQLDIDTTNNGSLMIDGDFNGANNVTVERSTAVDTPDFQIFNITGNADVTIDALTIRNGNGGVTNNGGGINHNGTGTLALTHSTVRDNVAKDGGGIYSQGAVNLMNSTVSGNTATDDGGGIYSEGAVNLINSTISGNTAVDDGGGVRSLNGGFITNSTITNNIADSSRDGNGDGGGVVRSFQGTFTIRNSIIAGNFDNSPVGYAIHSDVSGDNISGDGNNLIGETTGRNGTLGTGSDLTLRGLGITDINQVLVPLGDYGGSTQTHALVPGSPGLNAGDNANVPGGVTTDQRGARRIVNTVDIGAFESQGFVLQAVGTPQSTMVNTVFANPVTVRLADAFGNTAIPVAGIPVTFATPNAGASGTATNGTVSTNANGIAQTAFTANTIAGSYQVSATTPGMPGTSLNLTNTPDSPNPITVTGGNHSSATGTSMANSNLIYTRSNSISNGSRDRAPTTTPPSNSPTTTPPQPIKPPQLQDTAPDLMTAMALACLEVTEPENFTLLDFKISTIAGLMNAEGGSTAILMGNLANECRYDVVANSGNEEQANAYLQQIITERIGEVHADLVEVRLVSLPEGTTAIIEVQPAPQPTFLQESNEEIFYLYEDGETRNLEPEAVERYVQQRWPQRSGF